MKSKMMPHPDVESADEDAAEPADYEKHEVEHAADTLMKAEQIKGKPKLHSHAMKHLEAKHKAIGNIVGKKPKDMEDLKAIAKAKLKE